MTLLRIHHGIFEEISSKGIGKLGGDDLDTALGNLLAKRFQDKTGYDILNSPYKTQFMLAVEKAKIELSSQPTTVCRKAELVPERHLSLEEEIDRQTFEKEIMQLVVKSGTAIDEALSLRGMKPKDALVATCKRVVETTTRDPRFRDDRGRPNFNVVFYCLTKDGRFAAAHIHGPASLAVHDG